ASRRLRESRSDWKERPLGRRTRGSALAHLRGDRAFGCRRSFRHPPAKLAPDGGGAVARRVSQARRDATGARVDARAFGILVGDRSLPRARWKGLLLWIGVTHGIDTGRLPRRRGLRFFVRAFFLVSIRTWCVAGALDFNRSGQRRRRARPRDRPTKREYALCW